MKLPIALQLYSIKDETEKDFIASLKKVSNIGYDGVEFAGYGGLSSDTLKNILAELNIRPLGSHVNINELTTNLDDVITYNINLGNKYIVCPYASFNNESDFYKFSDTLNSIGKTLKDNGLILSYHNHAHEFVSYNANYGLDILINNTDPNLVNFELDTYWVKYGGVDPIEYISNHSGRFNLIHLKDMEIVNNEKRSTEIGNGIIDIEGIINFSKEQGTEAFIIEQEFFNIDCIKSIEISYKNINNIYRSV